MEEKVKSLNSTKTEAHRADKNLTFSQFKDHSIPFSIQNTQITATASPKSFSLFPFAKASMNFHLTEQSTLLETPSSPQPPLTICVINLMPLHNAQCTKT
jgi:hypothetical protein